MYRLRGAVELAALTYHVQNPNPQVFARLWEILEKYRDNLAVHDWESADEWDMAFHRELGELLRQPATHPSLRHGLGGDPDVPACIGLSSPRPPRHGGLACKHPARGRKG